MHHHFSQSSIVNILILNKFLLHQGINQMRLIRIHSPSRLQLPLPLLQNIPTDLFHHKLSCNFIPSFLPVYPCIKYDDCNWINPCVISDQSKPTVCHCSEFVLELDESIVIKFVFIECSLLVECYWVGRAQLLEGNYCLFYLLHFGFALYVTFEWTQEKAVRWLFDLCDVDVFGFF